MDVTNIVNRLILAVPSLAQVVAGSLSGNAPLQASQAGLVTLFGPIVNGRMSPLQDEEGGEYPSAVYQLIGSRADGVDGYDVTRTDSYALVVMAKSYDELISLQGQIVTACNGQNIDLLDVSHDFYERESLYVLNISLDYSFVALESQLVPAVFVMPLSQSAGPSLFDNFTRQQVTTDYSVAIVADGGMSAVVDEVRAALLGWQQTPDHFDIEYVSGSAVRAVGDLVVWRQVYRDAAFIFET